MGRVILFTRVSTEQQHLESQEESLRRAAIFDDWAEADMKVIGKKESAIKLDEEEREGQKELDGLRHQRFLVRQHGKVQLTYPIFALLVTLFKKKNDGKRYDCKR